MTPEKLGRYEILGELGKGAMGVVFLARDPLIGRQLALKTFRLGYSAGDQELEQFRTRFLREAQSAGILSHPNIVTIHDVVVDEGGDFFIAMEYVQGTDLKLVMQRQGRFEPRFAIDVVAQISDGLGYAHSKGVVHRDIKPANIILTAEKQAKITDFGIARVEASNLTMEGQLLGTPNYMAPEQIQGREVDHRADIFSLGVMFYEMITGKKPFAAPNLTAVTHKIVFEPFPPLEEIVQGLPPEITRVLERALAKEPAERYDSGTEMAGDLRAVYAVPGTGAVQAPPAARTGSFLTPTGPPPVGQPMVGAPPAAAAAPSSFQPPASQPIPISMDGTLADSTLATTVGSPAADAAAAVVGPPAAVPPAASGALPEIELPDLADAVGPPPGGQQPGKPFLGMPSFGRFALTIVAALALGLVAAGIARLAVKDDDVVPQGEDPELQRQTEVLPFLKQGQQLLEAGEPAEALEAFERAVAIVPDDREIRRWRDRAEQRALLLEGEDQETWIAEHLEAARKKLGRRDWAAAVELAEQVLVVDPEHQEGQVLLREANDGLSNQQASARPPPPTATPAAAPPPPVQAPVAEATLNLEFVSEISEGRLTIFSGQERIYQTPFEFVSDRKGRSRKATGSLKDRLKLPSGKIVLYIYAKPKDDQTKSVELEGNLAPGSTRVLHIELSESGRVKARLD